MLVVRGAMTLPKSQRRIYQVQLPLLESGNTGREKHEMKSAPIIGSSIKSCLCSLNLNFLTLRSWSSTASMRHISTKKRHRINWNLGVMRFPNGFR